MLRFTTRGTNTADMLNSGDPTGHWLFLAIKCDYLKSLVNVNDQVNSMRGGYNSFTMCKSMVTKRPLPTPLCSSNRVKLFTSQGGFVFHFTTEVLADWGEGSWGCLGKEGTNSCLSLQGLLSGYPGCLGKSGRQRTSRKTNTNQKKWANIWGMQDLLLAVAGARGSQKGRKVAQKANTADLDLY